MKNSYLFRSGCSVRGCSPSFYRWLIISFFLFASAIFANALQLEKTQLDLSLAAGFDHLPVEIGLSGVTDIEAVSVTSDSSWVSGEVDASSETVVLSFATADLVNQSYTATISVSEGGNSVSLFVRAFLVPLNIVRLADDPFRSRVYGVHLDGTRIGALVAFDPHTETKIGSLTMGMRPTDLAVSNDGSELFVISSVSEEIHVVDLRKLEVSEVIRLPEFENSSAGVTTARIAVGAEDVLYYADGASAPNLRVFNRASGQVLQKVLMSNNRGFGDMVLSHDRTKLFGWAQFGWSAGWAGSFIRRIRWHRTVGLLMSREPIRITRRC